jgi:integrase
LLPYQDAKARNLVGRNVATLADTPKGQAGRPSKSLTLEQASALLAVSEGTRMHAYISLCLATGIRTEEARELRWDHVDFGDPGCAAACSGERGGLAVGAS